MDMRGLLLTSESTDFQAATDLDLRTLLNGGLPLDKVGPHLRHAARRALRTGDPAGMQIVAKVIISELLRRGDLLRVAVQGDGDGSPQYCLVKGTSQLLDLSGLDIQTRPLLLSNPLDPPAEEPVLGLAIVPEAEPGHGLRGIDSMLVAMEDAQKLDFSDPRSGETGVILDSILRLLAKFTPQFELHIMLFEDAPVLEKQNRVFILKKEPEALDWFRIREPGHSVWIPRANELPEAIKSPAGGLKDDLTDLSAVAVPLYDPHGTSENLTQRKEVGLLFLVTPGTWTRDTMLRLGTRLSRFVTHRWQQHSEVNKRIHIDALTGLFNRGYFEGQLEILLERAKRSKSPLTLIVLDLDHFKEVNDNYDHLVGDQILKMVARRMQEELRRIDHICRLGGEEFCLILPDTDFEAAREVMLRLLNSTFKETVNFGGKQVEVEVTISYGAATYPHSGTDAQELYRKADTILFLSKDRGRNQCHFWSTDGNHVQLLPESRST
jgi:diguanylate cyclase (GGDEF)-like protein